MRLALALLAALLLAPAAGAQGFRLDEGKGAFDPARLKPGVVAFQDAADPALADPVTGLIRFEDWARTDPLRKRLLSLHPGYEEPVIDVSVNGLTKKYKEKLHVYVAQARFLVPRAPGSIDLSRFATPAFLEQMDPSITHKRIDAADAVPHRDPDEAHARHPNRRWCEGALCIESRYQLEGRLPLGVRLANKLEEGGKKIAEHLTFQSELRALKPGEFDETAIQGLTGLSTPVAGVLEQTIFHVNQMMQFGKFLAVVQADPTDPGRSIATAFITIAVETDVLEKKKEYESVPVLRNMVPAQILLGKSSFNTGDSLSAGLPDYARNRIRAAAEAIAKG